MPDAIHGSHVNAVGDGVGALDGPPRVVLRGAKLVLLRRVPADRRGIEQHLGALQSRQPRALGIPLVPADQRAHAANGGIHGLKAQIARREVILLVIKRIVGDVHLAVDAGDLAIGVQRDRGVVVKPRRAALEERGNDGHARLRAPPRPACPSTGPESAPPGRRGADPRAGRNTACGKARAGRRSARPAAPPRECGRARTSKFASGSAPMRICTRATVNLRAMVIRRLSILRHSRPWRTQQGQPRQAELALSSWPPTCRPLYSSRISTAAAIVVVHLPRLSPTADWVTLLVRTILLEMR